MHAPSSPASNVAATQALCHPHPDCLLQHRPACCASGALGVQMHLEASKVVSQIADCRRRQPARDGVTGVFGA